ncbi:MAG: diguanylate cyclase [bacterium]|nr:diguanylate cyclase [bacterium]
MYYEYYLSNGLFSILILMFLYINSILRRGKTTCDRLLRGVIGVAILLGVCDTASWMMSGQDFPFSKVLQYLSNGLGDILIGLITYLWFLYAFEETIGSIKYRKKRMILVTIPIILSILLVFSTAHTHWIFYINDSLEYVRGSLFLFILCVPVTYILGASVMSFIRYKKEIYESRKQNCLLLASFPVFPLIGSIIQAFYFGLSLYVPCLTLSVLLIYLNQQNHSLTLDALTQLNNRGQLDYYLEKRFTSFIKNEKTFFLLMDVDCFKEINDTYGHIEGDEALIMVAAALKQSFKQRDAFIARYGGDEFAVLMEEASLEDVNEIRMKINDTLDVMTRTDKKPYHLSISVGAVHCGMEQIHSVSDLIAAADAEMFRIKNRRKARLLKK